MRKTSEGAVKVQWFTRLLEGSRPKYSVWQARLLIVRVNRSKFLTKEQGWSTVA